MKHARTWMLLGVGALLVASSGAAQDRMQGSGIRVTKERPAASITPDGGITAIESGEVALTTPFDLAAYNNMIESNITAHMAAGDSLEIQLGQLAQTKATDQRVRDFGTMLVNDHRAHLAKTHEIITDEDVGATPLANDPEGMRLREALAMLRNKTAGASWDADFLRFQVQHHQNEIDMLTANIKVAHDDDLEDHIEKSIQSLTKHRDSARSVATQLGVVTP